MSNWSLIVEDEMGYEPLNAPLRLYEVVEESDNVFQTVHRGEASIITLKCQRCDSRTFNVGYRRPDIEGKPQYNDELWLRCPKCGWEVCAMWQTG